MEHLKALLFSPKIYYGPALLAVAIVEIVYIFNKDLVSLSSAENYLLLVLGLLLAGKLAERDRPQPRKCFDVMDAWGGPFDEYVAEASDEIFVSAGSMDGLLRNFGHVLKDKANNGCKIRLVMMDPQSPTVSCVEKWADPALMGTYYKDLHTTQGMLARLWEDLTVTGRENFEVKLNPSIPALSVLIVDGSRLSGKIRVDMQPFQCPVKQRPVFELQRKGDQERWYKLFRKQYSQELWKQATPFDLETHPGRLKEQEVEV